MANKNKRCCNCKKYFLAESMKKNNAGYFCNIGCIAEYAAKRVKKQQDKAKVERKKVFIANDRTKQLKLTQDAFNKMRRHEELLWFQEKGLVPTCISCRKPIGGDQWACGHFKTVAARSDLQFDRRNTYLQHNVRCNRNLSGDIAGTSNTIGYTAGILDRFGPEEGQAILDYCNRSVQIADWKCDQLIGMRKGFNAEIRRIEKLLTT